jgi:hypothetical protein
MTCPLNDLLSTPFHSHHLQNFCINKGSNTPTFHGSTCSCNFHGWHKLQRAKNTGSYTFHNKKNSNNRSRHCRAPWLGLATAVAAVCRALVSSNRRRTADRGLDAWPGHRRWWASPRPVGEAARPGTSPRPAGEAVRLAGDTAVAGGEAGAGARRPESRVPSCRGALCCVRFAGPTGPLAACGRLLQRRSEAPP